MSALPLSLQERFAALDKSLAERSPQIKLILHEIHTTLKKQPENVTLLSEDEIAIVFQSLEQVTGTHFAISQTKGSGSGKTAKKAATMSLKDLGF